jgi:hypothetical protein
VSSELCECFLYGIQKPQRGFQIVLGDDVGLLYQV